jgi:hypothetical protein
VFPEERQYLSPLVYVSAQNSAIIQERSNSDSNLIIFQQEQKKVGVVDDTEPLSPSGVNIGYYYRHQLILLHPISDIMRKYQDMVFVHKCQLMEKNILVFKNAKYLHYQILHQVPYHCQHYYC